MSHTTTPHLPFFNGDLPFYLLVESWVISDTLKLVIACLGVFVVSILHEFLKNSRKICDQMFFEESASVQEGNLQTFMISNNNTRNENSWTLHLGYALLYTIQMVIKYLMMLSVMTFNIWIILSVCIGEGIGFLCVETLQSYLMRKCNQLRSEQDSHHESDTSQRVQFWNEEEEMRTKASE